MPVVDARTDGQRQAQIFVTEPGASNYTFGQSTTGWRRDIDHSADSYPVDGELQTFDERKRFWLTGSRRRGRLFAPP